MPLFDRLHRPDALVDPRQADDQPDVRGPHIVKQPVNHEQSNENRVERQCNHTAHGHDILPQHFAPVAATRPALQGHAHMADPPLPNPHSSTQAIGSVLPPTLQGVMAESAIMRSFPSRGQPNGIFYGAPSCDFASPTTLTTPFTMMTTGPGTPPTYDESMYGFRRVESSFSGFTGLQMSPTTAPTSVGSTVVGYATPKVRMGGYMAEPLLQQQELERLQQKLLQQQLIQQQEQEMQSPIPMRSVDEAPAKSFSKPEELQVGEVEQPKLLDRCDTYPTTFPEFQSSYSAAFPESSHQDHFLNYTTPEHIQQQQRDFMLSQQQKYTSFSLGRRASTGHPTGLPPSPSPQAMETPRTSPRPFATSPSRSLGTSPPRTFGSSPRRSFGSSAPLSNSFNHKSERYPSMSAPPPFAPMHSCAMQALAGMPPFGPTGPFGMPPVPFGGPVEGPMGPMGPGGLGMGPPGFPMPGMPGMVPPIPGMMPF